MDHCSHGILSMSGEPERGSRHVGWISASELTEGYEQVSHRVGCNLQSVGGNAHVEEIQSTEVGVEQSYIEL